MRKDMKARRAALAVADPQAGEALADAFETRGDWPEGGVVIAGFHPMQSEIDPLPLLMRFHARGYPLALPSLFESAEGLQMIFRAYDPVAHLVEGPYGIWQPSNDAVEVLPDIVLVPLLAFDKQGGRLGYGGGFYDRALHYLKAVKPVKERPLMLWGIGFSGQEIAKVPMEPHDQRLDAVLTERGWVEIRKTF
nr:5-formyltetrahydrofolate cyclo-ligase [Asticcacaulis aquaticus]